MKQWVKYIAIVAIGIFVGYQITLTFLPHAIYGKAKRTILSRPGNVINSLKTAPIIDANARVVVMPNPDFIYCTAFYDLSKGPLQLTGDMPDSTYWSVALYHPNTVNWYIKNDLDFGEGPLALTLQMTDEDKVQTAQNAYTQKSEGFMLVRVLVTDRTEEQIRATQNALDKIKLSSL